NVAEIIKKIEEKEGRVTGVIHGAGLNSLKRLKQMSVTEALSESLPKVFGAVNVCKALSQNPPKLIVAITSIIGITGMEGSGWYGLANEVLNLYLHQFKAQHPKTQVAAIAYSVWDEIGMGAKLGSVERLAQKGIGAIPVVEGVKRFRQLIESDSGSQQVIVAARVAGIDTWKSINSLSLEGSNTYRSLPLEGRGREG
ncbi:MAG: KR domain-containing protein, partial [Candidatus Omnitrophica bacterium]|nr:KR domain-containing protein [Candidatus Omnitrophota bacterium]